MFLAYQPHLYERDKRVAAARSPGPEQDAEISPRSSTSRPSVQAQRRPSATSTLTASSSSSARRHSKDGSASMSRDDGSILSTRKSPASSSSSGSVFSKRRFRRPKTSGDESMPHLPREGLQLQEHVASPRSSLAYPPPPLDSTLHEESSPTTSPSDLVALQGGGGMLPEAQLLPRQYHTKEHRTGPEGSFAAHTATTAAVLKRATRRLTDWLPSETKVLEGDAPMDAGSVSLHAGQSGAMRLPRSDIILDGYLNQDSRLDGLGITSSPQYTLKPTAEGPGEREKGPVDLSHYPLPIRLGLIKPAHLSHSVRKRLRRSDRPFPPWSDQTEVETKVQPTQYCHGYYLYAAPPNKGGEGKVVNQAGSAAGSDASSSSHRDIRRLAPSGRGRSGSLPAQPDLSRRPSQSSSGGHQQHWKLEQYFRAYKRKVASRTCDYKFHAFSRQQACYWWGYNVQTLVSETLTHNMITAIAGLSVIDWDENILPSRVLDIGTGVGNWVIDMAREWKETEFVGLDLVPVQTPLKHFDDDDLRNRVSWVVANALQRLPFPDNSFDYIHIRMINAGVPEDKWAFIISEAVRVLCPGGHLEIFEADWSFFGAPKEMLTNDLQDLLEGKSRLTHDALKMRKRRNGRRYDKLGLAVDAMLQTRLIKPDPSSTIPFHLASSEVGDIGQGRSRHFPILARSSTHRMHQAAKEQSSSKYGNQTSWTAAEINEQSFTSRPQIGQPLPRHRFNVESMDVLRMAILVADVVRISEARDAIWKESLRGGKAHSLWDHFGQFEREMDDWCKDMMDRADMENLLKSTFDWNEAASRMDSRIQDDREERKRMRGKSAAGSSHSASPSHRSPSLEFNEDGEEGIDVDEEDRDTVRQGTPTPSSVLQTTAVLNFRTTTAFTARKKPM